MAKLALLIAVSEYEPGLISLPGSVKDVDAMQRVLAHPEMGGFAEADITVMKNPQRREMEYAIYRLFSDRKKDDLLLLYFSGHGIKDERGKLYLATRETYKINDKLCKPSAVAAALLHESINESKSQRQVIILDCCFSGAIAQGLMVKDDGTVNLKEQLGGRGRAILTSSSSSEYSFGSDASTHQKSELSIYTNYLVEGIEKGAADADGDGWISIDELHEYAYGRVKEAAPAMTPKFYPCEEGYKILLAKSPKDDPQLKYRKELQARVKLGQGTLSPFAQKLLQSKRLQWGISLEEAKTIEDEVLQPYREYERKLAEYEQAVIEAAQAGYPFSAAYEADLKEYQQYLELRDTDIGAVESKVLMFLDLQAECHQQTGDQLKQQEQEQLQENAAQIDQLLDKSAESKHQEGLKKKEQAEPQHQESRTQTTEAFEYYSLGIALQKEGKLSEAVMEYRRAIQLNPNFADTYNKLGELLYNQGKLDEAIVEWHTAIQINPNFALPYYGLGCALRDQNKLDEAIAHCHLAIQLDPDYVYAHYNLGVCLRRQGKLDEAIEKYRAAIKINPDYVESRLSLGIALCLQNKFDEGIVEFRTAIRLDPKKADSYYKLGWGLKQQGKLDEAIEEYRVALQLDPNIVDAYVDLGIIFTMQGKLDEAVAEYDSAIQISPNHSIAHEGLGYCLKQQDKLDEAIEEYHTAIQINPNYANARRNLGDALYDQGKLDEAIEEYRIAIQIEPDYADAHHWLGWALEKKGKLDEAIEELNCALRLNPNLVSARQSLEAAIVKRSRLRL